jgi:hypothetical protein
MDNPDQSMPAEQAAADGPGAGEDQPVSRLAGDPMAERKKRRTAQPEVVMRSVSIPTVAVAAVTKGTVVWLRELYAVRPVIKQSASQPLTRQQLPVLCSKCSMMCF